jgi:hypothetical protein
LDATGDDGGEHVDATGDDVVIGHGIGGIIS